MKKSLSVIFALFCMTPVLLACDIECKDVLPMETTITTIDTLVKNARFETNPQNIQARWGTACANFPRLAGELDEHREKLKELLPSLKKDEKSAKAYSSALLVDRHVGELQKEMSYMCGLVEQGADHTDISSSKGTLLREAADRTIAYIRNQIVAAGKPLRDKACNKGKVSFLRPTGAQEDPRVCEGQKGSLHEPSFEVQAPAAAPAASAGSARG